jgi:hypothetical protein
VSTFYDLIEQLRLSSPRYLDLLTSPSDEDFQSAFDRLLGEKLTEMEENKKNFQAMDEVGLSAVLKIGMSIPGFLVVTQESNCNGHVDLTFISHGLTITRTIRGEAKIYDGPKYHLEGLSQLFGYMTGRELRGLMIVYIRKPNGVALMQKVRDTMDYELPENQQEPIENHPTLKWAFNSKHLHSSGESLLVSHVACNLYVDKQ